MDRMRRILTVVVMSLLLLSCADASVKEYKLQVVAELEENGIFHVKGAVEYVASCLHVSIPTVYNYLKTVYGDEFMEIPKEIPDYDIFKKCLKQPAVLEEHISGLRKFNEKFK